MTNMHTDVVTIFIAHGDYYGLWFRSQIHIDAFIEQLCDCDDHEIRMATIKIPRRVAADDVSWQRIVEHAKREAKAFDWIRGDALRSEETEGRAA